MGNTFKTPFGHQNMEKSKRSAFTRNVFNHKQNINNDSETSIVNDAMGQVLELDMTRGLEVSILEHSNDQIEPQITDRDMMPQSCSSIAGMDEDEEDRGASQRFNKLVLIENGVLRSAQVEDDEGEQEEEDDEEEEGESESQSSAQSNMHGAKRHISENASKKDSSEENLSDKRDRGSFGKLKHKMQHNQGTHPKG